MSLAEHPAQQKADTKMDGFTCKGGRVTHLRQLAEDWSLPPVAQSEEGLDPLEWGEHTDEHTYEVTQVDGDPYLAGYVPATDAERFAWLEQIAPRVVPQVP